jgi:hypothetical protein
VIILPGLVDVRMLDQKAHLPMQLDKTVSGSLHFSSFSSFTASKIYQALKILSPNSSRIHKEIENTRKFSKLRTLTNDFYKLFQLSTGTKGDTKN